MKVAIFPEATSPSNGGVMNCAYNLRRVLPKLGVEVVNDPDEADVVHGHAFDGSPNVYTSHGVYPSGHKLDSYNRELYRNIATADVVTAVSQWTASQFDFIHVDPIIIPNGVDLAYLKQFRREPRGYILWAKNTADELSNAVAFVDLARQFPGKRFAMTVAPEGHGLPSNLDVIGLQSHPDMMKWMAGASAYISTGTENLPIQVLEAKALGVPVVALPRGGVGEIVGIHVTEDLRDGLDYVLAHRQELSERGMREVEERYTWEIVGKQYIEQYERSLRAEHNGRISVVIPCYNLSRSVGRAVESCLKQTLPPSEIIVVDDGSTDHPEKALEKYSEYIQLVKLKNGGVARARNTGIEQATGEFICCLDADDALTPDFLAQTYKEISRKNSVGIAYTGMTFVSPNAFRPMSDAPGEPTTLKKMVRGNGIPCANLFRKKAWRAAGGYKNINPSWEDYDLWLSILEVGFTAELAAHARLLYTAHDQGRSGEESRGNHSKLLRATVDGYHPRLYGNSAWVTFVIPCYNQWQYVFEAVESAWQQTYPHIEVIVVDDKSTAFDQAVYDKIMAYFPKTIVVFRETNGGLSAARNTGIAHASGGLIVPLDADDKVEPIFVAECLKVGYGLSEYIYTDILIWHNDGQGPTEVYEMSTFDPDRVRTHHQHACTVLYRRDWALKIGGYDEQMLDGWEDYEFTIGLVKSGHCGLRVPKPLLYYRQRETSMRLEAENKRASITRYIWNKHKDVAQGASLMACCGGDTRIRAAAVPPPSVEDIFVPEGFVLVQYQGLRTGQMTREGNQRRVYAYDAEHREFLVHEDDIMLFPGPFVLVKDHKQSVAQQEALTRPAPEPVKTLDINDAVPEGDEDLKVIEGIDAEKETALKEAGLNTYQRLSLAPDEQLEQFFTKRAVKKVRNAAFDLVRQATGV